LLDYIVVRHYLWGNKRFLGLYESREDDRRRRRPEREDDNEDEEESIIPTDHLVAQWRFPEPQRYDKIHLAPREITLIPEYGCVAWITNSPCGYSGFHGEEGNHPGSYDTLQIWRLPWLSVDSPSSSSHTVPIHFLDRGHLLYQTQRARKIRHLRWLGPHSTSFPLRDKNSNTETALQPTDAPGWLLWHEHMDSHLTAYAWSNCIQPISTAYTVRQRHLPLVHDWDDISVHSRPDKDDEKDEKKERGGLQIAVDPLGRYLMTVAPWTRHNRKAVHSACLGTPSGVCWKWWHIEPNEPCPLKMLRERGDHAWLNSGKTRSFSSSSLPAGMEEMDPTSAHCHSFRIEWDRSDRFCLQWSISHPQSDSIAATTTTTVGYRSTRRLTDTPSQFYHSNVAHLNATGNTDTVPAPEWHSYTADPNQLVSPQEKQQAECSQDVLLMWTDPLSSLRTAAVNEKDITEEGGTRLLPGQSQSPCFQCGCWPSFACVGGCFPPASYCSVDCQMKGWASHRPRCRRMEKKRKRPRNDCSSSPPPPLESVSTLLRVPVNVARMVKPEEYNEQAEWHRLFGYLVPSASSLSSATTPQSSSVSTISKRGRALSATFKKSAMMDNRRRRRCVANDRDNVKPFSLHSNLRLAGTENKPRVLASASAWKRFTLEILELVMNRPYRRRVYAESLEVQRVRFPPLSSSSSSSTNNTEIPLELENQFDVRVRKDASFQAGQVIGIYEGRYYEEQQVERRCGTYNDKLFHFSVRTGRFKECSECQSDLSVYQHFTVNAAQGYGNGYIECINDSVASIFSDATAAADDNDTTTTTLPTSSTPGTTTTTTTTTTNCQVLTVVVDRVPFLVVYALSNIAGGSRLLLSYGADYWNQMIVNHGHCTHYPLVVY
jgi:hypothetical protein